MRKPGQMAAFDALYGIAARDGRGEALFGDSIELARPSFERTLVDSGYPKAYFEFPLLGKPCFDLLSGYDHVEPGAKFAPGRGFGRQGMIDWFAGVCGSGSTAGCGFELDTSTGETERAAVYLQQRSRHELVEPFLESVGERGRARAYFDVFERMPQEWLPSYVGLFPGREGAPMRIGGYMGADELAHCADDPRHLSERFRQIGFTAFDAPMLERCAEFMALAPSIDFQFDIMPDGTLGDAFGLSLSFNEALPFEARECMESGYGATVMQTLQEWGLADDRWKLIAGASLARCVGYEREDGTQGHFALCILLNYAKVKFRACEPQPAKFYLACTAGDIEA